MKDKRVRVFHQSLDELVESLDATLRLARWADKDVPPEPLEQSAAQLMTRLGTADRLAAGVFKGTPRDVARVRTLTDAMRRLEQAYLVYARTNESAPGRGQAMADLSTTLDQIRTETLAPQ